MTVVERITVVEAMRRAQHMHANGWDNITEIQRYLAARGVPRSWQTIKRWCQPRFFELERERKRSQERRRWAAKTTGKLGRHDHTTDFRFARVKALDTHGVSFSAIAVVMNFDFGDAITPDQVRYALKAGRYPQRAVNPDHRDRVAA